MEDIIYPLVFFVGVKKRKLKKPMVRSKGGKHFSDGNKQNSNMIEN